MENFEQNVVTLVRGEEKITLINENGKTMVDCDDPQRDGRMICQTDRAFNAFCNTLVTLMGYNMSNKRGGAR